MSEAVNQIAASSASEEFDLSVIVPVFNAESQLRPLVKEILSIGSISCQVILVDDCSEDGSRAEIAALTAEYPQVLGIYQDINLGAGRARNTAWPQAKGRYTIFFDADDQIHTEVIPSAILAMDNNIDVDVAVFCYRYKRGHDTGFTDMLSHDRHIISNILDGKDEYLGSLDGMASLLGITNYPWNKIIRTQRFRETGLKYGSTKVNNDILGHWYSLLFARRILLLNKVICTHIVLPNGNNITNIFTRDRLQLFDALAETYNLLLENPMLRSRYAHHFWGLVDTTIRWARPRMDPQIHLEFDTRCRNLVNQIDIEDFVSLRTRHAPHIADKLVKMFIG